jgi:hypothetical protein
MIDWVKVAYFWQGFIETMPLGQKGVTVSEDGSFQILAATAGILEKARIDPGRLRGRMGAYAHGREIGRVMQESMQRRTAEAGGANEALKEVAVSDLQAAPIGAFHLNEEFRKQLDADEESEKDTLPARTPEGSTGTDRPPLSRSD